MRALFQKLRASTSSKGASNGYTPSSKELEKEKNFRPLPEWPPPSLNQTTTKEEPKATAVAVAPVAPVAPIISESSTNASVRYPSQLTNRPSQAISLDSELPPLPSFAGLIDIGTEDNKSRRRGLYTLFILSRMFGECPSIV